MSLLIACAWGRTGAGRVRFLAWKLWALTPHGSAPQGRRQEPRLLRTCSPVMPGNGLRATEHAPPAHPKTALLALHPPPALPEHPAAHACNAAACRALGGRRTSRAPSHWQSPSGAPPRLTAMNSAISSMALRRVVLGTSTLCASASPVQGLELRLSLRGWVGFVGGGWAGVGAMRSSLCHAFLRG